MRLLACSLTVKQGKRVPSACKRVSISKSYTQKIPELLPSYNPLIYDHPLLYHPHSIQELRMGVEYNYNKYEIPFSKVAARHYQTGGIKEEAKAEGWSVVVLKAKSCCR